MIRGVRLVRVPHDGLTETQSADGLDEEETLRHLSGYILEQVFEPSPAAAVVAWGYLVVGPPRPLQLLSVDRLVPAGALEALPEAPPAVRALRRVRSGRSYRITSPPARGLVTPDVAESLETVFERFAGEQGFSPERPLEIRFSRGFEAGSRGHGEGRAVDIAAVSGKSLLAWKLEWDRATTTAEALSEPQERAEAIAAEQKRNLGYGLYKALQGHGGWRVDSRGWRPYRNVMQLFGPWTATEGPWKAMQIKDPNPYQRQRLADQGWVFRAHRDHIHVAR